MHVGYTPSAGGYGRRDMLEQSSSVIEAPKLTDEERAHYRWLAISLIDGIALECPKPSETLTRLLVTLDDIIHEILARVP